MKRYLYLLLLFFGQSFADPIEELDQFIQQARKEWNVPGLSIVIVKDGNVLFQKGYGVANVETGEKVNAETLFQLASVTKTFTAAALGVQVDRKRISWDEPILGYLPEFALKNAYPTCYTTTRDLLAHRTGLPAFEGDLLGKLGFSDEEILQKVSLIEPASTFREQAHYSNLGYFIAGELLGQLSGLPWKEAVERTLLQPLAMKRTGFAEKLADKNVAFPHILVNGKAKTVPWDRTGGFPAAGAVTSTASDMGIWMTMLLNRGKHNDQEILKEETVWEMFKSSMAATPSFSEAAPIGRFSGFDFGMGWDNYHYQGRMIVEKGGGLDGIRTLTTLVPQDSLGITILSNLNLTLLPEAVRARFLELFIAKSEEDLQSLIKKQSEKVLEIIQRPKRPENPLPLCQPIENYTGDFESPLYGTFRIRKEKDTLVVLAGPGRYRGTLTHFSGGTFILDWPVVNFGGDQVHFTFGDKEKAVLMHIESLGTFR